MGGKRHQRSNGSGERWRLDHSANHESAGYQATVKRIHCGKKNVMEMECGHFMYSLIHRQSVLNVRDRLALDDCVDL